MQEKAIGLIRSKSYDDLALRMSQTEPESYLAKLEKDIREYRKKINSFLPVQPYILINTTLNRFRLFDKNGSLIREGLVSTGSYTLLRGNNRQWMFKTPRGQLKVLGKTKNPVWVRPDWAFIEEGLKVPPAGHPSRFEYGTLGDYSLNLGNGYLIHGTLYKRFLGLPVTHGCVRMGDEDLEATFKTLQLGSRVYIY
ncbi:MAG: L,D-transpeptidase [Bacteroidetes bacterium]|nr:L,D-transpeptidase [Bacteroidota bacterium]